MILNHILDKFEDRLRHANVDSPRVECRQLACRILNINRWQLRDWLDNPIPDQFVRPLISALRKRAAGMPAAYILGTKEFYALDFKVSEDCLIPRPESEGLVEACVDSIRAEAITRPKTTPTQSRKPPMILDLGTGSGCLAISCLTLLEHAEAWAVDLSLPALRLAQLNARAHKVQHRFYPWCGSWMEALNDTVTFDVIIANPPYIPVATINPDLRYEPSLALSGGIDGCDCYRNIATKLAQFLKPHGRCFMETDLRAKSTLTDIYPPSQWRHTYTSIQNEIAILELSAHHHT